MTRRERLVGRVTQFEAETRTMDVKLGAGLALGERIRVRARDSGEVRFEQTVQAMRVGAQEVEKAKRDDTVSIVAVGLVYVKDKVFAVSRDILRPPPPPPIEPEPGPVEPGPTGPEPPRPPPDWEPTFPDVPEPPDPEPPGPEDEPPDLPDPDDFPDFGGDGGEPGPRKRRKKKRHPKGGGLGG